MTLICLIKVVGTVFIKQIIHCQVWGREGPAPVCSVLKTTVIITFVMSCLLWHTLLTNKFMLCVFYISVPNYFYSYENRGLQT